MKLRFVYKIYSGYDGFTPSHIPQRLHRGRFRLGWRRYIEAVERGQEVWVYFHGPHGFEPGVYLKGRVDQISSTGRVTLRALRYRVRRPLTDHRTSRWVASVARRRGEQIFILPERGRLRPYCDVWTDARTCGAGRCVSCPFLKSVPLVGSRSFFWPSRLDAGLADFVPAFWVVPSRCFLSGRRLKAKILEGNEIFYRFKTGEKVLGFPLAVGMRKALRRRRLGRFDAIVPIPLSPEKRKAGEAHRTLLLARHLSSLLRARVLNGLKLKRPLTKRGYMARGGTRVGFEERYQQVLGVSRQISRAKRVLLVDDVCTHGSTLRAAAESMRQVNPALEIVGMAAGLMIRKEVVCRKRALVRQRNRRGNPRARR